MTRRPSRLVLLGHPVAHSLSPLLQNAALRAAAIPLSYEALDVAPEKLEACLVALHDAGAAGNVTIPHKARAARICDTLTPLAQRVGAVNTFWVEEGRLVGDNTDVGGFAAAVRALLGNDPRDVRVGVLGAGGAAAAVLCAATAWRGVKVALHARRRERAEALRERFPGLLIAPTPVEAARDATLVVNATPIGLEDDEMPLAPDLLASDTSVLDLVYRPGETAWVRATRARGLRAADGLGMLVEQGALAFERWLGTTPDRSVMWSAVR